MKRISYLILIVFALASVGCPNILREFANKETDEARFYAAKIHMNAGEWTEAIAEFEAMSAAYLSENEVTFQYATAYAGRCGYDFLGMVQALSDGLAVPERFLDILFGAMQGTTATEAADCLQSEAILRGLSGYPGSLTAKENTTLAFVSFSKIGGLLAANADDADANGVIDADFNACTVGGVGLSDADAAAIGTGINIGTRALTNALAGAAGVGSDELAELDGLCSLITTLYPTQDFCSDFEEADILADAEKVKGVRFSIKDNQVFGTGDTNNCNIGLPANCTCP